MHSDTENTWIICEGVSFLTIYNVTSVQIQNMAFMGCGESTLQEINLLTIYNSMFQGYSNYDSGTALLLIHSKANITKSSFLSNTGTYQFPLDNVFLQGDKYKQVGGAIAAYQSELWITACEFHGNSAEVGGAIFIEETTIFIGYTLFENNFAKAHDKGQSDNIYYYNRRSYNCLLELLCEYQLLNIFQQFGIKKITRSIIQLQKHNICA